MSETVFFQHDGVRVTNATFTVDSTTYSVRNITSTQAWTSPQQWLLTAALVLAALVSAGSAQNTIAAGGNALFFGLLAYAAYHFGRPWHFVKLNTSGGEVKAIKSRDKSYVSQVVAALNQAIVAQHNPA